MMLHPQRWRLWLIGVAAGTALLSSLSLGLAQTKTTGFNEREIEPQIHAFDRPDVWTLHFRFKDPRIITCDVPGHDKKKVVWYMLYQVINHTGEPRVFVPSIELKTHDYETVHTDELQPSVQRYISKIEDPNGKLDIKNSVTILAEPIPISKKDAYPRAVYGVAIWTDVYDRAPKTNRFSIFIAGLSDAWRKDPKTDIIRRKTLQINFQRLGDDIQNDPNAIRWIDNPQWMYRVTDEDLTGKGKDKDKEAEKGNGKVIIEPIKEARIEKDGLLPPLLPMPRENVLLPMKR